MGRGTWGFYETYLIWEDNHLPLKNKISNSLGRLSSLIKNLTHRKQLERYDNIIQDRIKKGIIEKEDKVCEQEIDRGRESVSFAT